jgi:hypothetical protein
MLSAMGMWEALRRTAGLGSMSSAPTRMLDIVSPMSADTLPKIVWSDVFGTQPRVLTREEALSLPGVFKARGVLLSLLAGAPLVAYDADELELAEAEGREPKPLPRAQQPAWLQRNAGGVSPWHRMAATLDDHIFYGWSLWTGNDDGRARVPLERWRFARDGSGTLELDPAGAGAWRHATDADELTLIPGASEGLLAYGARALNGAVAIDEAWVDKAKNPIAATELHQTVESNLDEAGAKAYVEAWNQARIEGKGGAAFTPYDIEARIHGQISPDLYIEGRNGSRIDIANYFNMPASLIDGSVSTASLTYSTQEGDANEIALYTVPYWRDPIVGRLSLDDVAGPGVVIRQNLRGLVSPQLSPIGDPGNE